MLLSVLAVIVVLSPIVIIHEFGHFLACRLTGIRVNEFAFGFGKILWHKKVGHTDYQVRAIPFGGFVNPAGEMFHPQDAKEAPKSYEFASKKWYAKFFMVVNGALFNYVLAAVVFTGLIYVKGLPETDATKLRPVIGAVMAQYPAEKAGLKESDEILTLNGAPIATWQQLTDAMKNRPTGDVTLTVSRNGQTLDLRANAADFNAKQPNVLGITVLPEMKPVGILTAANEGLYQCWYWTKFSLQSLWQSVTHKKAPDLAGPIGIVNIIHKSVHTGLAEFIFLIGMLSLAVGMFNLFPIPILDGGYALVFLWEGISGKLPTQKVVNVAANIGFYILITLVLYASYSDVKRIFFKPKKAVAAAQAAPAPAPEAQTQKAP